MESPTPSSTEKPKPGPQMPLTHTPSSSGKRRLGSDSANSPEFEFWMVRNPSFPQPDLLSADELFVDGVLLPLHLLHLHPHHHPPDDDPPNSDQTTQKSDDPPPDPEPKSDPCPRPELPTPTAALGSSKRWKDIFKKSDRKSDRKNEEKEKEKEKKSERKAGGGGARSAELNINIWPFSRSRSAGNGGARPRTAANRKVSSAPCSRSNSAGESKSRKWPASPSRGGVHLGRASPVWQVRRGRVSEPVGVRKEGNEAGRKNLAASSGAAAAGGGGVGAGGARAARVLNLNVPTCIGYRQHLSCRSDESGAVSVAAVGSGGNGGGQSGGSGSGDGGRGGNLFNLRSIFTKKVY